MDIQNIIQAIDSQNYYITNHADEEAQDDGLDFEEIFYSVRNGEIRLCCMNTWLLLLSFSV